MNVPLTRKSTSSAAVALAALLVVGAAGIADACTHHDTAPANEACASAGTPVQPQTSRAPLARPDACAATSARRVPGSTDDRSPFTHGPGSRTAGLPGSPALAVSITKSGYHRPATGPVLPGDYVKVAVTGCPAGVEGTTSSKAFTRPTTLFPTEGRIQGFAKISQVDPGTYPVTVTCPGTSAAGHAHVNVA
ncbi:hypothetical protein [Streptomyces sp. NPDC059918]|uniref:hypothetical protein n=1 Tax=unclassified Streptomyces TaxID=2593676 RepID=UPI003667D0E9